MKISILNSPPGNALGVREKKALMVNSLLKDIQTIILQQMNPFLNVLWATALIRFVFCAHILIA